MAESAIVIDALNCPFCGEKPITGEAIARNELDGTYTLGYVRCLNMRCHIRPSVGSTKKKGESEQSAIMRWNIRA